MTDTKRNTTGKEHDGKPVGEETLTDGLGALPRLSEDADEETADAQPEKGGGLRGG